jgi:hypothetical protein
VADVGEQCVNLERIADPAVVVRVHSWGSTAREAMARAAAGRVQTRGSQMVRGRSSRALAVSWGWMSVAAARVRACSRRV